MIQKINYYLLFLSLAFAEILSAQIINPVSVNGSTEYIPQTNFRTFKFWEDQGQFPRTFDYKISNLPPNGMIFLSPLNRTDTILLTTADGRVIDFNMVAIQLFEWAIVPVEFNTEYSDNTLLLKIRRKFNSEVGILPIVKCRLMDFATFTSEVQKNRLDRGWVFGSSIFLLFLSVLFAIAVKNPLIIRFSELCFVIFLIILFNESNIFQNQLEYFHPSLLLLNVLVILVGFRYTEYARSLKKGFGEYTLNWKVIVLGLTLLVLVNFLFRESVWLGVLVLALEVLAVLSLIFLYIYHTYYFKWYNQFILILLTLTSEFVILSQYFNDRILGLSLTEVLVSELVIAAVLTARVIVWEFEENYKMMEQNLKIQQQMGLIHLESVENERKRIVQELQDDILFKINGLEKQVKSDSTELSNNNRNDSFFKQLDKTLKSLRKYTYQLYPPHIQQLNVNDIFQREVEIMQSGEKSIKFKYEGLYANAESFEFKSNLYRIFQQFLKNRNWNINNPIIKVKYFENEQYSKWTFSTNAQRFYDSVQLDNQSIELYIKILQAKFQQFDNGFTWEIEIPNNNSKSVSPKYKTLAVGLLSFCSLGLFANTHINLNNEQELYSKDIQYVQNDLLKPPVESLKLNHIGVSFFPDVITVDSFQNWVKRDSNYKINRTSKVIPEHWFYYRLYVPEKLGNRVFYIPDYQINHLELYIKNPLGHVQKIVNFGDEISVDQFSMNTRTAQSDYLFQDTGLYEIFVRHNRAGMQPKLFIRLSKVNVFLDHWNYFEWLYGVIYGFIISYLIFILWGFLNTQQISYGFFFLWVLMNFLHNFISTGHLKFWFFQYVESGFSSLRLATAIFAAYAINQYALFHYDQIKRLKWLYKLSNVLALVLFAILISIFILNVRFYVGFERLAIVLIRIIIGVFLIVQIYLPLLHFIRFRKITYLTWVLILGIINGAIFIYQTGKIEPVDFDYYCIFTNLIFILEVIIVAWGSVKYTLKQQRDRQALFEQNIELQKEINRKQNEVQEKERMRIAMELHDDVLNRMSILLLLARDQYIDNNEVANNLKEIGQDIKHYILGLYPYWTKEAELNSVIKNNLLEIAKKLRIELKFNVEVSNLNFSKLQRLQLFRIAQEFIQNSGKHGNASLVEITISESLTGFQIQFQDNGLGFDPKEFIPGLGTQGAKQRIQTLGGSMQIISLKGEGVKWMITIPKFASLQTSTPMSLHPPHQS
jgi:signal transduction histidine kinase